MKILLSNFWYIFSFLNHNDIHYLDSRDFSGSQPTIGSSPSSEENDHTPLILPKIFHTYFLWWKKLWLIAILFYSKSKMRDNDLLKNITSTYCRIQRIFDDIFGNFLNNAHFVSKTISHKINPWNKTILSHFYLLYFLIYLYRRLCVSHVFCLAWGSLQFDQLRCFFVFI